MRYKFLFTICLACFLVVSCSGDESKKEEERPMPKEVSESRPVVRLYTDLGEIDIELRPDVAPKTCENFLKLVGEEFYDSLTFHRIIPGFMMQGGDPDGTGRGGPGYTVPAEISGLKHIAGTVATARLGDGANPEKASSGSQFYICFRPAPHLDGQYTIFGQVVRGMETVEKVEKVPMADPRMGTPKKPVYLLKAEVLDDE